MVYRRLLSTTTRPEKVFLDLARVTAAKRGRGLEARGDGGGNIADRGRGMAFSPENPAKPAVAMIQQGRYAAV